jgi:hypothetical protein
MRTMIKRRSKEENLFSKSIEILDGTAHVLDGHPLVS